MPPLFSDRNLQVVTIDDFSPGIVRYARSGGGSPLVFSQSQLGSAADCYRCYVRPNIGLYPFPSYEPVMTVQAGDPNFAVCCSIGSMASMASRGNILGSVVATVLVQTGQAPEASTSFYINRKDIDGVTLGSSGVYASPANPFTGFPGETMSWPTMDFAVWQDPTSGIYARTVLTVDPLNNNWVTVRGWNTSTSAAPQDAQAGTFPLIQGFNFYPRCFYHENRGVVMQVGSTTTADGFFAADADVMTVSNILSPATWTNAGVFFPELGTYTGCWGSYSTGELLLVYAEGGGVLIYGDLFAPQQVVKLPGLAGCDAIGKAALSRSGLIYSSATQGVYRWNGDNTSTFISQQLPEDEFIRNKQPPNFSSSPIFNSSSYAWAHWVVFPNNWVFDTTTNSWWISESGNVMRFNVYADPAGTQAQFLYASPGVATAVAGGTAVVTVYAFNQANPSSSYFWLSNPIPVMVGALVSLEYIELNASNSTATAATVTIQPQAFTGNAQFQNTTQAQPIVFEIPPNTNNYRASQRLGFTDYNIQIALSSANSNANNAAPTVHSINLGYIPTRSSNV